MTWLKQFHREGFLLFEEFFAASLMDSLLTLSVEHFGDDPAFEHDEAFIDQSQTDVVPWFPQDTTASAFGIIDEDPRLERLTGSILGKRWHRQYCMVMFSKPGSKGQAWHQDCPPEEPGAFNLNRLVYPADVSEATGGQVVLVPGSHRRGLLPAGDPVAALDDQVVLEPQKGSLLLLHGHTWHRVLPVGRRPRVSVNYRAAPQRAPGDITDVCVYRNMRYRFSTGEIIEDRRTPES